MTDPLLENGSQVQQVANVAPQLRRCSNPQKWGFARKALKVSKGSFWWHTKITDKPIIWNNHITWYSCYILKTTWRPCLLLVAILQMSQIRGFLSSWVDGEVILEIPSSGAPKGSFLTVGVQINIALGIQLAPLGFGAALFENFLIRKILFSLRIEGKKTSNQLGFDKQLKSTPKIATNIVLSQILIVSWFVLNRSFTKHPYFFMKDQFNWFPMSFAIYHPQVPFFAVQDFEKARVTWHLTCHQRSPHGPMVKWKNTLRIGHFVEETTPTTKDRVGIGIWKSIILVWCFQPPTILVIFFTNLNLRSFANNSPILYYNLNYRIWRGSLLAHFNPPAMSVWASWFTSGERWTKKNILRKKHSWICQII